MDKNIPGPTEIELHQKIKHIEPVGTYAIQPTFLDFHYVRDTAPNGASIVSLNARVYFGCGTIRR